jgi:hypothetical protein
LTDDALPDGARETPDERDQALLGALAAAFGTADDADLIRRCEGLLTWVDVEAELATLLDQAPAELAGTRGGAAASDLEFTIDDGTCVIEVKVADGSVRGQILGVAPEHVVLRVVTGVVTPAEVDDFGAFSITAPPPGSARIELNVAGRRIHTDWFVI